MVDRLSLLPALCVAAVVSLTAHRRGGLTRTGAIAALTIGTAALATGWSWGGFLFSWYFGTALVTRAVERWRRLPDHGVMAKSGRRDGWQVLANGGVFAGAALAQGAGVSPSMDWALVGAAALAAAGADTMATEIGTRWGRAPWSLRTGRRAPEGTSGAMSIVGTVAMVVAAMAFAWLAAGWQLTEPAAIPAIATAAIFGAMVDTLIGAWWQERRVCPLCHRATEQLIHRCGTPTRPHGGVVWLTNDVVNLLCTLVAALLAVPFGQWFNGL
jgi:uncharacterized protein (TIGR00297 family)